MFSVSVGAKTCVILLLGLLFLLLFLFTFSPWKNFCSVEIFQNEFETSSNGLLCRNGDVISISIDVDEGIDVGGGAETSVFARLSSLKASSPDVG